MTLQRNEQVRKDLDTADKMLRACWDNVIKAEPAALRDLIVIELQNAREAEREACAKIAEKWGQREPELTDTAFIPGADHGERYASAGIADAIRART